MKQIKTYKENGKVVIEEDGVIEILHINLSKFNKMVYTKEEIVEEKAKERVQEGINSRNIEIAKNMLNKVDVNTISKYTNLSKKEIEKLKQVFLFFKHKTSRI